MKRKLISLIISVYLVFGIVYAMVGQSISNISLADAPRRDLSKLNITRIQGSNRYETAVEASKKTFKNSNYVVIASGEGFSDALVGGTLAVQIKAPILLTEKNTISNNVIAEIKRLGVKEIFILGGTNTISNTVEIKLKETGVKVERIAGNDRFETAYEIANKRFELSGNNTMGDLVAVVNAYNFPDALSAAPFVGQLNNRGILTYLYPFKDQTHARFVFGGYRSVPRLVSEGERFDGDDRFETAVEVAEDYYEYLKINLDTVIIVDGTNFPDALASAPVASENKAAILLTFPRKLEEETREFLDENLNITNIIIVGGENSVSSKIFK